MTKQKGLMALTKNDLVNKINMLQNQISNPPPPKTENQASAKDSLSNRNSSPDLTFLINRIEALEKTVTTLENNNIVLTNSLKAIKEINKDLADDIYHLQKDLSSLDQYSRRWNIEIKNIPDDFEQELLAPSVFHAINQMDVRINEDSLEAVHRLKKSKNSKGSASVIVRFKNRDDAYKSMKNKKKSSNVLKTTFGQSMKGNIFIHENLCPQYKEIFDFCMSRKAVGELFKVWSFKGVTHILFDDDEYEKPTTVRHYDDLWDLFPDE